MFVFLGLKHKLWGENSDNWSENLTNGVRPSRLGITLGF